MDLLNMPIIAPRYAAPRCAPPLFLLAFAFAGCNSNADAPVLQPVTGMVMLDGKPLADATVTFYATGPAAPGYSASLGKTDAAGKYELVSKGTPGAVPGAFKVTISRIVAANGATVKPEEGMDLHQLSRQGLAKESVPNKYATLDQTELTVTVEGGKSNGYDFDLKSS